MAKTYIEYYKINDNNFAIYEDSVFSRPFIINDKKNITVSQKEMFRDYFNTVYEVFLNKLNNFKNLERPANNKECEGLIHSLKMLFDAKRMIYEYDGGERNNPACN